LSLTRGEKKKLTVGERDGTRLPDILGRGLSTILLPYARDIVGERKGHVKKKMTGTMIPSSSTIAEKGSAETHASENWGSSKLVAPKGRGVRPQQSSKNHWAPPDGQNPGRTICGT